MAPERQITTMGMMGIAGWPALRPVVQEAPSALPKEIKREKKDLSLGELNPLIHVVDLSRTDGLTEVARAKIKKYGGQPPISLESTLVHDPVTDKMAPRFIARFEVDELTEEKMAFLEKLVKDTYKVKVRTTLSPDGDALPADNYPPINPTNVRRKTGGWYMGPNLGPLTGHHQGLYVFRDLGEVNKDTFFDESATDSRYILEIREDGFYQTDLVNFIVQVSSVLGQSRLLDHGELLYEVYYDLIRLGLKRKEGLSVYGMEDAIAQIKRGLVLPLANRELSEEVEQDPESVLLIGVPGTGKTLVVEQLLQEDNGVFVLPIDPNELYRELKLPPEKQTILPRISDVARSTGKRVVLHVDDIENMAQNETETHSTLLNLMAGVRDSGFYVIASTNDPEKIDPALLQPQRFGTIIHFGLQDLNARKEILNIHASSHSPNLDLPLFDSSEIREIILAELARLTGGFTPRYLAKIATVAKSHLMERIAQIKGQHIGLTDEDLKGHTFTVEDWERAYMDVSSKYDKKQVTDRDKALSEFVNRHRKPIGFSARNGHSTEGSIFSKEVHRRLSQL